MDIIKLAQEFEAAAKSEESSNGKNLMVKLTAALQGVAMVHQISHWTTVGDNFYGDHQLYQRLYEMAQEHLDMAAEKTMGLFSDALSMQNFSKYTNEFISKTSVPGDVLTSSIQAEKAILDVIENAYESIKKSNLMTLGLDDFLMSLANDHEESIYLLNQRASQENSDESEKEEIQEEDDMDDIIEIL